MDSALYTWAQEIAISYDDRNPTLHDYGDFHFAEMKGWNVAMNGLVVNKHDVP